MRYKVINIYICACVNSGWKKKENIQLSLYYCKKLIVRYIYAVHPWRAELNGKTKAFRTRYRETTLLWAQNDFGK